MSGSCKCCYRRGISRLEEVVDGVAQSPSQHDFTNMSSPRKAGTKAGVDDGGRTGPPEHTGPLAHNPGSMSLSRPRKRRSEEPRRASKWQRNRLYVCVCVQHCAARRTAHSGAYMEPAPAPRYACAYLWFQINRRRLRPSHLQLHTLDYPAVPTPPACIHSSAFLAFQRVVFVAPSTQSVAQPAHAQPQPHACLT